MTAPHYGDGGQWPKGYGSIVKELARAIEQVGIAVWDLPASDHSGTPNDPRRVALTSARGYSLSLAKIFGGPIEMHTQTDAFDGIEFVTFARKDG